MFLEERNRGLEWSRLSKLKHKSTSVKEFTASEYERVIRKSAFHNKLINDSFRTLKTDTEFTEKVPHSVITRVLNATLNALNNDQEDDELKDDELKDDEDEDEEDFEFTYVQGMNVMLAPFLFVQDELQAFNCYLRFIRLECPTYVQPNLEGVHAGVKIFEWCLKKVDPELYSYLLGKGLTPQIYAFSPLMTFGACLPGLPTLIQLWDVFHRFGFKLAIPALTAHLITFRAVLMASSKPSHLLRGSWDHPLQNASLIIQNALTIYLALSKEFPAFGHALQNHLTDLSTCKQIVLEGLEK